MKLTPRQEWCLQRMDVTPWSLRETDASADPAAARAPPAAPSNRRPEDRAGTVTGRFARAAPALEAGRAEMGDPASGEAAGALDALSRQAAACTRCALHRQRTQAVFGTGAADAAWMAIGEAPGAEEDRRGEPFVGRAGQLLDSMLAAAGWQREEVYIANIVKCRPPDNRDPRPEEAERCFSYLERQIRLVAPRLILALGRVAAQNLLQTGAPVGRLRGRGHELPGLGIPVVVTYHPAYLLRSPREKRKAWQDLRLATSITGKSP